MRSKTGILATLLSIALLACEPLLAQQASQQVRKERHVGRIVGTVAGAVGGVMLGFGLADDDAPNATPKATVAMVLGGIGGGVGGYFLGRAVDRKIAYSSKPDDYTIKQAQALVLERLARDFGRKLRPKTEGHGEPASR